MFSSDRCGKQITGKKNLTRHQKTHLQSTESYTCDVCGQDFDREDARNRDMKTHVDSSHTYSCRVCGKEFSRADTINRYEVALSYSLTCGVYGQYFNRMDNLARHRVQHERPEAKQTTDEDTSSTSTKTQPKAATYRVTTTKDPPSCSRHGGSIRRSRDQSLA